MSDRKRTKKPRKKKEKSRENLPAHYQDMPTDHRWWEVKASNVKDKKPWRPPKFEDPEDLYQAIMEYFQWVNAHPLYEDTVHAYKGKTIHAPIYKKRPFTQRGLQLFLNITAQTWENIKKRGGVFLEICSMAEDAIYQQKFEGAATGFFNASIIARDLGLKEQNEVSGPGGGPIRTHNENSPDFDVSDFTDDELVQFSRLLNKARKQSKEQGEEDEA